MAGFQPVRADAKPQQRVAVGLVLWRAPVKQKFLLREHGVILRVILDQTGGQQPQIAQRHAVTGGGPTVGICEG